MIKIELKVKLVTKFCLSFFDAEVAAATRDDIYKGVESTNEGHEFRTTDQSQVWKLQNPSSLSSLLESGEWRSFDKKISSKTLKPIRPTAQTSNF